MGVKCLLKVARNVTDWARDDVILSFYLTCGASKLNMHPNTETRGADCRLINLKMCVSLINLRMCVFREYTRTLNPNHVGCAGRYLYTPHTKHGTFSTRPQTQTPQP